MIQWLGIHLPVQVDLIKGWKIPYDATGQPKPIQLLKPTRSTACALPQEKPQQWEASANSHSPQQKKALSAVKLIN